MQKPIIIIDYGVGNLRSVQKKIQRLGTEAEITSNIDTISIKHNAHTREAFANGAVLAAEFIKNKKGIFTMKDVISK